MNLIETDVTFSSSDDMLSSVFKGAEEVCRKNIRKFGSYRVLIEGGGYNKIWLETQPMGGEMYGKRDAEIALNNTLLFITSIRDDGRLPGSIAYRDGRLEPEYNKFQGFCFADPALNVFYYSEESDFEYLDALEDALMRFDAYLWKYRDSDGDGCLETWCRYDTGEDNTLRLGPDAENYWIGEDAPKGFSTLPVASMDFMGYSYSSRAVLSSIAHIKKDWEKEKEWRAKADAVSKKLVSYLWDEEKGALFDRDNQHRAIPALIHNNLRCMYWKSLPKDLGRRFVIDHVLNPDEFWTPMPLPSIAVDDPYFRNIISNAWTGQPEALTYQRAIRALENYGFEWMLPILGRKLITAIGKDMAFVQQFDPFTSQPSYYALGGSQQNYGPAALAVLEYVSRMHGVSIERNTVRWADCADGVAFDYAQTWGDKTFRIRGDGQKTECLIDGKTVHSLHPGTEILTDMDGNIIKTISLENKIPCLHRKSC